MTSSCSCALNFTQNWIISSLFSIPYLFPHLNYPLNRQKRDRKITDTKPEPRASLTSIRNTVGFAKVLPFPTQSNQSKSKKQNPKQYPLNNSLSARTNHIHRITQQQKSST